MNKTETNRSITERTKTMKTRTKKEIQAVDTMLFMAVDTIKYAKEKLASGESAFALQALKDFLENVHAGAIKRA